MSIQLHPQPLAVEVRPDMQPILVVDGLLAGEPEVRLEEIAVMGDEERLEGGGQAHEAQELFGEDVALVYVKPGPGG